MEPTSCVKFGGGMSEVVPLFRLIDLIKSRGRCQKSLEVGGCGISELANTHQGIFDPQ